MSSLLALFTMAYISTSPSLAQLASPTAIASQYNLATSTSLAFPTATLSSTDTQSHIVSSWSLSKGRIQNRAQDLQFVTDPFPNSPVPGTTASSGPVLQVTYPQGSFSHDTGGTQFYSLWNTTDGSSFESMLLYYEVAFDADFDWVLGGKLPGLRGGPVVDGCSGGDPSNGTDCFSSRVMWRKNAAGEVYAYVPESNQLCSQDGYRCNDDGFGTSIERGSFTFAAGQWNSITMLVRLNNALNEAGGQIALYYNNVKAIDERSVQIRRSDDITIGGLYFSTFFGGEDSSWATPKTVHTYFRNIQLWGSSSPSNFTGPTVSGAASLCATPASGLALWLAGLVAMFLGAAMW